MQNKNNQHRLTLKNRTAEQGFTLIDRRAQHGFTLIELSIVLVIIGLIVGGVLVGQDLIKAARVRATVGQYEKYNAAVNTFRTKYNGVPGDLATAASYGFTAATAGTYVIPGNGVLETTTGSAEGSKTFGGWETNLFWTHLSAANLVEFNLADQSVGGAPPIAITTAEANNYFPAAKMGRSNFFLAFNDSGVNYYEITGCCVGAGIPTTGAYSGKLQFSLTPLEAQNIDQKIDDGLPFTGVAEGMRSANALGTGCDGSTFITHAGSGGGDACCGAGGDTNVYTVDTASHANAPACQLSLKFN